MRSVTPDGTTGVRPHPDDGPRAEAGTVVVDRAVEAAFDPLPEHATRTATQPTATADRAPRVTTD